MTNRYVVRRSNNQWYVLDTRQGRGKNLKGILCRTRELARKRARELNVQSNFPPQDLHVEQHTQ